MSTRLRTVKIGAFLGIGVLGAWGAWSAGASAIGSNSSATEVAPIVSPVLWEEGPSGELTEVRGAVVNSRAGVPADLPEDLQEVTEAGGASSPLVAEQLAAIDENATRLADATLIVVTTPAMETRQDVLDYIAGQREALRAAEQSDDDTEVVAVITLSRPISQDELDGLRTKTGFTFDYFEWIGTEGISGVVSTVVASDLDEVQRNIADSGVEVIGYIAVRVAASVRGLLELGEDPLVDAVDPGPLSQILEAKRNGTAYVVQMPPRLYYKLHHLK